MNSRNLTTWINCEVQTRMNIGYDSHFTRVSAQRCSLKSAKIPSCFYWGKMTIKEIDCFLYTSFSVRQNNFLKMWKKCERVNEIPSEWKHSKTETEDQWLTKASDYCNSFPSLSPLLFSFSVPFPPSLFSFLPPSLLLSLLLPCPFCDKQNQQSKPNPKICMLKLVTQLILEIDL